MFGRKFRELKEARRNSELVESRHVEEMRRLQIARSRAYRQYLNDNLRVDRKRRMGWREPGTPDRDFSQEDRRTSIGKARQKVEESPIVGGMMQTLVDNVVGSGFTLRMTTSNDKFNRDIEKRWIYAKNKLDIRGLRRWGRLQRMWFYRKIIDGDAFILRVDGEPMQNLGKPLFLQTIESERVRKDPAKQDIGIEFDESGRPVVYYVGGRIKNTNDTNAKLDQGKPIEAKNIIWYQNFPQERAERDRGVTAMLTDLNLFEDLEQIVGGMIQKVKNEAFIGLFFGMELSADGSLMGNQIEEVKEAEDGKDRRHVKMIPGMNMRGTPGERVDVIESKSPNSEFIPFLRMVIRFSGTPLGLPLEMMLLDFGDTNFSGGRAIVELAKKRFRVEQDELAYVSDQVFNWWFINEMTHNKLEVPEELRGPQAMAHKWGKPGWPYLDPQKEITAAGLAIDRALSTRQGVLSEIGDEDFEDIVIQLEREQKLMNEHGVQNVIGLPGTTVNTPSADDGREDEDALP